MTPQHRAIVAEVARLKGELRLMRKRAVLAEAALRFAEVRATAAWCEQERATLAKYSEHDIAQPALQYGADEPEARVVARAKHEGRA